jgi:hypothetical protein
VGGLRGVGISSDSLVLTDDHIVSRNFSIFFGESYSIHCSAFPFDRDTGHKGMQVNNYTPNTPLPLMAWVERIIMRAPSQ